jgi:hypothetical protein
MTASRKDQAMTTHDRSTTALTVTSIVLYALAGIVLVVGVYMGLAFANAPAAVRGLTIAFQTPALTPLWDALASGLAFTGAIVLVISLAVSMLLIAGGLLLRRSVVLSRRVQRLEAALEHVDLPLNVAPAVRR